MTDWLSSMQQTFEYYIVDPGTWKDKEPIDNVTECTIKRELDADTLGSATIGVTDSIGEKYIRIYLIAIQNGVREKHPLGTYLVQTPSISFDGKVKSITMDAYTPLLEFKEKYPPLGYSVMKNQNIMDTVYDLCKENTRAPVVKPNCDKTLFSDFVAETDDTWLEFLSDLMSNAKHSFSVDEVGRILFSPEQDTASLQPIWEYTDDNSSILYPDINLDRDLYGVPNVVEVIVSRDTYQYYARVVNDDPNSPTSTVSRGREIIHRSDDPDLIGDPTDNQIQEYAEQLLRDLSTLEYTITYTHGYCPVRVGDCVRINYKRAGIVGVKAKVISQTIKCKSGCSVTEKAIFTSQLWG